MLCLVLVPSISISYLAGRPGHFRVAAKVARALNIVSNVASSNSHRYSSTVQTRGRRK